MRFRSEQQLEAKATWRRLGRDDANSPKVAALPMAKKKRLFGKLTSGQGAPGGREVTSGSDSFARLVELDSHLGPREWKVPFD